MVVAGGDCEGVDWGCEKVKDCEFEFEFVFENVLVLEGNADEPEDDPEVLESKAEVTVAKRRRVSGDSDNRFISPEGVAGGLNADSEKEIGRTKRERETGGKLSTVPTCSDQTVTSRLRHSVFVLPKSPQSSRSVALPLTQKIQDVYSRLTRKAIPCRLRLFLSRRSAQLTKS